MSLTGKHILIIGGSSGIGYATAKRAIEAGAAVTVVGRRPEQVEAASIALGPRSSGLNCDVSDPEQLRVVAQQLGKIDHIFYTPGPFLVDPSLNLDDSSLREGMEIRFWAVVTLLKLLMPKLQENGSVILMSGTANWRPEGSPVALATLGAVETFVRAMAVTHAPTRFNAIAPGLTNTPFLKTFFGEDYETHLEQLAQMVPLKRFGNPDEIAHAAIFLMSNTFVNGITLTMDGGARLV